jgi:hypothetical protein
MIKCGGKLRPLRFRQLFLLITRQKLQALIHDLKLFPGHTTSSRVPK